MYSRDLSHYISYSANKYPVVVITGPRQSGKTTLAKHLFANKEYISLEDLDHREFAISDPRSFLNQFKNGAIIDEAQRAPNLFSYIQTHVDRSQQAGEFILTGSQNFLLLEKISQSLAGRAAIAHLLPLSYAELRNHISNINIDELIFNGGYPSIYARQIEPSDWLKNYINTYVEKDVRQIKNVADLSKFQRFIRLCAGRIGQLLNIASIATECGIDQTTARSWISILEASFLIFLLKPHYQNFNKRMVKQPKLYFYDTGLACYLLGIAKHQDLTNHYTRGNLFENFILLELIKQRFNQGKEHNLYFWRDSHGHEVDIIIEQSQNLIPIEIKSGQTISKDFFKNIQYWQDLSKTSLGFLIYGGNSNQMRQNLKILSWKNLQEVNL